MTPSKFFQARQTTCVLDPPAPEDCPLTLSSPTDAAGFYEAIEKVGGDLPNGTFRSEKHRSEKLVNRSYEVQNLFFIQYFKSAGILKIS